MFFRGGMIQRVRVEAVAEGLNSLLKSTLPGTVVSVDLPPKTLIDQLAPNPDYGTGSGFRNIVLTNFCGRVEVHLIDMLHEMRLSLAHDGSKVVAISAELIRFPTNLCPGSVNSIKMLEGTTVGVAAHKVGNGHIARLNCTHLFDLAALAIAHAGRKEICREYAVIIPDQVDGRSASTVTRNGSLVHTWVHDGQNIIEPAEFSGRPVKAGFFKWASQMLDDDALEAASILVKTAFIAVGRKIYGPELKGITLERNVMSHGICYAYQPERLAEGYFFGTNRRNTLEEALRG